MSVSTQVGSAAEAEPGATVARSAVATAEAIDACLTASTRTFEVVAPVRRDQTGQRALFNKA